LRRYSLVTKCEPDVSVCVAESVLEVLEEKFMTDADATVCTLQLATAAIREARRDPDVLEAWLLVLGRASPKYLFS
jgi:hypothetical protein